MIDDRGAYTARRAAALSGVPWSTVHGWSRPRRGLPPILEPSLSPSRVKLWSYSDLLSLRTIYWLRHPKPGPEGEDIPATSMSKVREALGALSVLNLELWEDDEPTVRVDRNGHVVVGQAGELTEPAGQGRLDVLDLTSPVQLEEGILGPDLVRPRPRLRIIPGKLAGSPHLERTRLETQALAALARRGVDRQGIYHLYPRFDVDAIDQALGLEEQLARNLEPRLAAA